MSFNLKQAVLLFKRLNQSPRLEFGQEKKVDNSAVFQGLDTNVYYMGVYVLCVDWKCLLVKL